MCHQSRKKYRLQFRFFASIGIIQSYRPSVGDSIPQSFRSCSSKDTQKRKFCKLYQQTADSKGFPASAVILKHLPAMQSAATKTQGLQLMFIAGSDPSDRQYVFSIGRGRRACLYRRYRRKKCLLRSTLREKLAFLGIELDPYYNDTPQISGLISRPYSKN